MLETQPEYYAALAPFRELFRTGLPILMYHKIGRRPAGARFRGLYLSKRLFSRQLDELRGDGFQSVSLSEAVAPGRPARAVALTFDDGFANVLRNAVEPMARHGYKGIQFIVSNLLGKQNEWDVRDGEVPER